MARIGGYSLVFRESDCTWYKFGGRAFCCVWEEGETHSTAVHCIFYFVPNCHCMCFKATCFAFLCRRTALHSNKYKSVSSLPREIMLLFWEVGKGMVENQLLLLLNVHPWQISMEVSIKKVHIILSCVHITYSLWVVGWDFMDGIQARRVDGCVVVRMHLKVAPLICLS